MRKERQFSFLPPPLLEFGGSLLENKRKSERVLALKRPIHLTLKGDTANSGSLLYKTKYIKEQIEKWSYKFDIKIYDFSINSNHIHFSAKISSRDNYKKFIKALTGRLAQVLKFKFIVRPFTKIISWGRQFKRLLEYIIQNKEEAAGERPYKPRCESRKQANSKTYKFKNMNFYRFEVTEALMLN